MAAVVYVTVLPGCSIDELQVSLFYLRAGYSPDDYQGEEEWQARKLMESCSAVSCPSVAYQLVGAKKIQQDLAGPGVWRVPCLYLTICWRWRSHEMQLEQSVLPCEMSWCLNMCRLVNRDTVCCNAETSQQVHCLLQVGTLCACRAARALHLR